MRIEPAVSRAKYEAEVRHLDAQADTLRKRGCWVQRVSYPEVDVVFLPRDPLRVTLPLQRSGSVIIRPRGAPMELGTFELPALSTRAFGVRVMMDDYDQRAPSVTFRDPWTWEPLPAHALPIGYTVEQGDKAQRVRLDIHPITKQPFLCLRGTREYHEHPQHTGDSWMLYRGNKGLFDLLTLVWLTCVQQARPRIAMPPQAPNDFLVWDPQSPADR